MYYLLFIIYFISAISQKLEGSERRTTIEYGPVLITYSIRTLQPSKTVKVRMTK
jgi:hypothetical protein